MVVGEEFEEIDGDFLRGLTMLEIGGKKKRQTLSFTGFLVL